MANIIRLNSYIKLNFTCSLVCDEVKIENVKSVLQDFIKRHSLVGFDVK